MEQLHNNMMRINAQGQAIEAAMDRGESVSKRIGLSQYADFENFLKGLLRGMTFANDNGACKGGLLTIVQEAFNLLEYREIYVPSNTMKFMISLNGVNKASNTVWA